MTPKSAEPPPSDPESMAIRDFLDLCAAIGGAPHADPKMLMRRFEKMRAAFQRNSPPPGRPEAAMTAPHARACGPYNPTRKVTQMTNALQPASATLMRNPFLEYAAAMTPRRFDGKLLKFDKGDYVYGVDNDELQAGTKLVALMPTLSLGYVHWRNRRPDDARMGLAVERFQAPKRRELGDLDQSTW